MFGPYLSLSWTFSQRESSGSRAPSELKGASFSLSPHSERLKTKPLSNAMIQRLMWHPGLKYCRLISVLRRTLSSTDRAIWSAPLILGVLFSKKSCYYSNRNPCEKCTLLRFFFFPLLPQHLLSRCPCVKHFTPNCSIGAVQEPSVRC